MSSGSQSHCTILVYRLPSDCVAFPLVVFLLAGSRVLFSGELSVSVILWTCDQRNSARFVCGEFRRGPGISVTALLQQLQWPSLADRRLIAWLTLFFNAHTGKISIPLCNLLDRSDSRTRGAKNNYKYISTKNTALANHSFRKL